MEIWYFLWTFWKDGLSKKDPADTWSFLYHLERWYFFPRKHSFPLPQEIHGNMTFSVFPYGCYKRATTPLRQKKSKMVLSRKNTTKGDWRSRLTSYEKLHQFSVLSWWPLRAFSCIALQRRKIGNLIYRIEVWPLLNLFCWRYSIANNIQYFVTFSQQELCLEVYLSATKENYLSIRRFYKVVILEM